MSKEILIQQIENMPNSVSRRLLNIIKDEYKNAYFEIVNTEEYGFRLRISTETEKYWEFNFDYVPIIKKYLQDTGCMQSAFDRYCKEIDEEKERVREELLR